MIFTIIIAFLSLILMLVLHEFGHFILAKKFGVKVEEFGVGYPPRIWGKKIGETIYSINALPFGAFVRMPGEIGGGTQDKRSFSSQTVWKRILIALAGVLSFWLMAAILFTVVFNLGTPISITDNEVVSSAKVQIVEIAVNSPAALAGLRTGDTVQKFTRVDEFQKFIEANKGQEVILTIERGKNIFDVSLVPRVSPPKGQGALGVALSRTVIKSYPWWQTPGQGLMATVDMTKNIILGYGQAIKNLIIRQPTGVELMGPVGVLHLFTQASQLGINYFLQLVGMIAIYIAIFNILPIPSVDGGKILFLIIEAVRKKPVSARIEERITTVFFSALLLIMAITTVKDIIRIF